MRYLLLMLALISVLAYGCDLASESADTTEEGGAGAVELAEQMSAGTIGEADMETGETAAEAEEGEDYGFDEGEE